MVIETNWSENDTTMYRDYILMDISWFIMNYQYRSCRDYIEVTTKDRDLYLPP